MRNDELVRTIAHKALLMRRHSLDMALVAGSNGAHLGPGNSMMEIMASLYFSIMKHDPKNPEWEERDRFILSKGHGVLGYYTALAEAGYFPVSMLKTFETDDSFLAGHPSLDMGHGIESTSGSLGMGISIAAGIALAGKSQRKSYTVYTYLGDGECNEGIVWEAAAAASHYGLSNLVAIIDRNLLQSDGISRDIIDFGDMAGKWRSFGWVVREIDGHDIGQILEALSYRSRPANRPYAIVAHTIKGKGVSFMENNNEWHHKKLTQAQYEQALVELSDEGGRA